MKGNILRRIEIVEKEINVNRIPEQERVVVITYPAGEKQIFDQKLQDRMAELREKYGPNITEDDFLVVGVRKFSREAMERART